MKKFKHSFLLILTILGFSLLYKLYLVEPDKPSAYSPIEKTIRLDYNPPAFPKSCEQPNFANLVIDNYYSQEMDLKVKVYLDEALIWEKAMEKNDYLTSKTKHTATYGGLSNLSIPIPDYKSLNKDEAPLTIQLIQEGEVIEEIVTTVNYLEEGETIEVANNPDCFLYQCGPKLPLSDYQIFNLDKRGQYAHTMTQVREVIKKDDHYQYTLSFEPGYLYAKDSKHKQMDLPLLAPKSVNIPLNFELVEGVKKIKGSGYYDFDQVQNEGPIKLGYAIDDYGLGMKLTIQYAGCEKQVIDSTKIYVPEKMNLVAL